MKRIAIVLLAILLVACQTPPSSRTFTNVSPNELNTMLADKDFLFVNVHIPFEGDIVGTDLSIPYDQITESANLEFLPVDKNAKIVLYCRSGRMSEIAANALLAIGYTNIYNLDGGMIEWERQGFELLGN